MGFPVPRKAGWLEGCCSMWTLFILAYHSSHVLGRFPKDRIIILYHTQGVRLEKIFEFV